MACHRDKTVRLYLHGTMGINVLQYKEQDSMLVSIRNAHVTLVSDFSCLLSAVVILKIHFKSSYTSQ